MGISLLLQIINGYVSVTALIVCFVFVRYFFRHVSLGYHELRAAIVFIVLCIGTVIFRGPIFIARILTNMGFEPISLDWAFLAGGLILEAAFLCMIRVFVPEPWATRSTIYTIILSTLVVGASVALVLWR